MKRCQKNWAAPPPHLDKIQIQQFFVGKPSLIVSVVNFTNVARCSFVPGKEPFKRNLRRTVMRHSTTQYTLYLLLSSLLSFSSSIIDHHHHHHDQVMRYVNLSTLLVYRLVSGKVLAYLCLFSLKYFQNTKDYIFNKKLFNWKKNTAIMTNWLQVKMRFPTMDSLVEAKLLLPHEADRLEKVDFRLNDEMM